MRQFLAGVAILLALVAAGGAGGAAKSALSGLASSTASVAASVQSDDASPDIVAGVSLPSDVLPPGVFAGIPGALDIALAKGSPTISRERAIELARPKTGALVSAVYAILPRSFMVAVLSSPKSPHPTPAWIVTFADVEQRSHGPVNAAGQSRSREQVRLGGTSVAISAMTGEQLVMTEYPAP
jgi:hypothetical protein